LQRARPAIRGQDDVEDARIGVFAHGQFHGGGQTGHTPDDVVTRPVQQRFEGGGKDTVRVSDHNLQLEDLPCAGISTVTASPPRSLTPR